MDEETNNLSEKKLERRKIPKRVNLSELPKSFREALGISPEIKSMSDVVEKDPFIQTTLQDVIQEYEQEEETTGKRCHPPKVLLEKRNTRIILLTKAGFKTKTIMDIVNARERTERRGIIKNMRAINKIREKFSRNPRPLYYENEEERILIESGKDKQLDVIEKLALTVQDEPKNDDKSIRKRATVQCKFIQLQQTFIDNQGRNIGRHSKAHPKKNDKEEYESEYMS